MAVDFTKLKQILKDNWVSAAAIFSFFGLYYSAILFKHIDTDIQAHAFVSYKFVTEGGTLTPNFLYFITVAFLAGFSKSKLLYYASSVFIISASLTAKYFVNKFYCTKISGFEKISKNRIWILSLASLFVFCLPGLNFFARNEFLLGQLAPNAWHNSTVIFLFPFAMVLFFELYALIQNYNAKKIPSVILLIIINALIKPSFLFTIIPAALLWAVINVNKNSRKVLINLFVVSTIALVIILVQYIIIYALGQDNPAQPCKDCSESVSVEPFAVWKYYSLSVPVSFVTSLFFPLVYFIVSKGNILKDNLVKFAIINWLIAMLIYVLFIETGGRKYHGNFGWQMIIGNYLLFFVLAIKLFCSKEPEVTEKMSFNIISVAFMLHLIWGVMYFLKIFFLKNYF